MDERFPNEAGFERDLAIVVEDGALGLWDAEDDKTVPQMLADLARDYVLPLADVEARYDEVLAEYEAYAEGTSALQDGSES